MHEFYPDTQWHHHIHPDTEPAFVIRPGDSCCPEPEDECVCVTESDVENWNKISALSSIKKEDLNNLKTLTTSSELWNSTYNTVSSNSAKILDTVSSVDVSAEIWNSAYKNIINTEKNTVEIEEILNKLEQLDGSKIIHDKSITGEGTSSKPYGVADYNLNVQKLYELDRLINGTNGKTRSINNIPALFNADGTPNWIPQNASDENLLTNPYIQKKLEEYHKENSAISASWEVHDEIIQDLLNKANVIQKEVELKTTWIKIPIPKKEKDITAFNAKDTIYYFTE